MVDFIQDTVDGIMIGSRYSLLAIGFTLIFGIMRRLNLSYGPSIMLGVFLGTFLFVQYKAGWLAVAAATLVGAVIAGIYVERICFWAVRQGAALASMVSSFAIWMQLEELTTVIFPDRTYPFPPLTSAVPFEIGGVEIQVSYLIMFGFAVALMVALNLALYRTRFGLAVRAVSENPLAARFMGVSTARTTFLAFVLASALGGFAGYLIAANEQQVTPLFGLWATFKGLIAMMLGGMGSVPGAILGGFLLGVIERHATSHLGIEFRDIAAYGLLFAVLVLRPGGLLGQRLAERERLAMRRV
jgi:branched-subunit amino acid ABC-type transport system permease component